MITMIIRSLATMDVASEKQVDDNWWDVYLQAARVDGRRITWHGENSYSVTYTEKNKVYTFER